MQNKRIELRNARALADELALLLASVKKERKDHVHEFSPKKFTEPQLYCLIFVCKLSRLVARLADGRSIEFPSDRAKLISILAELGPVSYRDLADLLKGYGVLRRALGLKYVPHYSTLSHAEKRLGFR